MARRKLSEEIQNDRENVKPESFPDEVGKLADEWGDLKDQIAALQEREAEIKKRLFTELQDNGGENITGSRFVVKYQSRTTVTHDDASIIGVLKNNGHLEPIEVVETLNFDKVQDLIYTGKMKLETIKDFIGEKKSEFPVVKRLKGGV